MNCIAHPHANAVGPCGICGAGLCHDCFTGSFYTWNDKPLCPSCSVRLVSELAAEARAEANSARFRVLLFVAALVVGVVTAIVTREPNAAFFLPVLGGIPTMWRLTQPRPSLAQTVEYAVQDGVEHAFGYYEGSLFRTLLCLAIRVFLVLAFSLIASFVLFFVALWKWRKAARQAAELEGDLAAMQEAGWRAAGSSKDAEPADPKTAARIRARHFAGPWKRGAPASAAESAPAPASRAVDVPPAAAQPPEPPSPGEAASARLAARMAAVDARLAARKAAIESSKR